MAKGKAKQKAKPTKARKEVALPVAAEAGSAAAAAAADPPAVLVGQAFALLKNDLCRGIGRTLSLPLHPQYFRVGALHVSKACSWCRSTNSRTPVVPEVLATAAPGHS